ncbi:tRNA (adenosine(37)-N6)-threonylcarbamoyltransferase complex dimerization subunit type 1 TsaB [Candidatus Poribacteria bacterium]|nr:tRNA (adenosine(37)-N6)-threonylcarbamoyltransferase complex dimerization subunit type 1 TsaB [Candidatus Poribacteria bacterium]
MKILGVDTSTPIGSVGLIDGDDFVAEYTLNIVHAHSSRLMLAIDQILRWANLTVRELDACAVAVGPGSFTGVRIGVATMKSLCYAIQKPIIGVSTLEAIACTLRYTDGLISPILDARRNEVYGAIFHGGKTLERKSDDLCLPIEAFLDRIDSPAIFVGDGLKRYAPAIRALLGESTIFADAIFNVPRGANVARLGYERLRKGEADDYFSITPNYVRRGDPWTSEHRRGSQGASM